MCVHMDANRTLSQLSYGPKSAIFNQKSYEKRIFEIFNFEGKVRKIGRLEGKNGPVMCVHMDANRTLSQLSYAPHVIFTLLSRACTAKHLGSQLSYGPICETVAGRARCASKVRNSI